MKAKNAPNVLKTLNGYAGGFKHLITAGRIIAAVSALAALVPFYDLWRIVSIAVKGEELSKISGVAWQAVIITIIALLLYIAALSSMSAAFRLSRSSVSRYIHSPVSSQL